LFNVDFMFQNNKINKIKIKIKTKIISHKPQALLNMFNLLLLFRKLLLIQMAIFFQQTLPLLIKHLQCNQTLLPKQIQQIYLERTATGACGLLRDGSAITVTLSLRCRVNGLGEGRQPVGLLGLIREPVKDIRAASEP